MKKKGLALVLATVLLLVAVTAGTLAWLTAKSDTVTNTFTTSDINVTLTETNETYQMIPGYSIHKDPKAKVLSGSEECYLFVKLEKSANFDAFMSYEVDTTEGNWTKLTGVTDEVYYRVVLAADINKDFEVLKGNCVTVKGEVTKAQMSALTDETYPTLTITAYASQLHKNATENFTAAEAWANANPTSSSTGNVTP